ncbi:MAG: hypothetical protein K6G01_06460 [Eubacterium sp.]|nr:hypothetical protein [Eubacterium sp.]
MSDSLKMSVSQAFKRNGKKYAFVTFRDGEREAEGRIPNCEITRNNGFDEGEVKLLEEYMKRELKNLKQMATQVDPMKEFFTKK